MVGDDQGQFDTPLAGPGAHAHPARGEGGQGIGEPARPAVGDGGGRGDDDLSGEVHAAGVSHRRQRPQIDAIARIEGVHLLQGAVDIDRPVVAGLAHQGDQPLRLAEGVGAHKVGALRELGQRGQEFGHLLAGRRVAEDGQAEGGFGDEDVAGDRLKALAGRIAAALVVAGHDDGQPAPADHHLGGAQHMAGGRQGDLDSVAAHGLSVVERHRRAGEIVAIAQAHDLQRRRRGQDQAVAGTGVVRVTVGDHGPLHRRGRIDVEVAGRAVEALGAGRQQVFRPQGHLDGLRGRRLGPVADRIDRLAQGVLAATPGLGLRLRRRGPARRGMA